MNVSHNNNRRLMAPMRHIGRNAIAYLALFLALGGTSFAAGKLLTGADIEDDSLTGADIVESSLAKVPDAANADQLGGVVASAFLKSGSTAGGALEGTYPNPDIASDAVTTKQIKDQTVGLVDLASGAVSAPKLLGGAAATNVWGDNQWAPANATQRGYVYLKTVYECPNNEPCKSQRGLESISYPVPLGPHEQLESHVILDTADPPAGCGGSIEEPSAEPGHICIFFRPSSDGDYVTDSNPSGEFYRYGRLLGVWDGNDENEGASANVAWAMTPPIG